MIFLGILKKVKVFVGRKNWINLHWKKRTSQSSSCVLERKWGRLNSFISKAMKWIHKMNLEKCYCLHWHTVESMKLRGIFSSVFWIMLVLINVRMLTSLTSNSQPSTVIVWYAYQQLIRIPLKRIFLNYCGIRTINSSLYNGWKVSTFKSIEDIIFKNIWFGK